LRANGKWRCEERAKEELRGASRKPRDVPRERERERERVSERERLRSKEEEKEKKKK